MKRRIGLQGSVAVGVIRVGDKAFCTGGDANEYGREHTKKPMVSSYGRNSRATECCI